PAPSSPPPYTTLFRSPTPDGVLVSPATGGATNWQAPSFDPDTGLLYVGTSRSYAMYYLTDTDPHPEGWGGLDTGVGNEGNALVADRKSTRLNSSHQII